MAVGRGNGAVAAEGDAADEEPEDSPRPAAKPVVFTHCRQSLALLHAPAAFKRDGPVLSYTLYRSECAVLQARQLAARRRADRRLRLHLTRCIRCVICTMFSCQTTG
eukprot:2434267-Pleurochrysis_carterae.AAC.3